MGTGTGFPYPPRRCVAMPRSGASRESGGPFTLCRTMDRVRGLTLPELIITLAVLAICTALAWPQFSSLMLRTKGTTALHLLGTSLASARMAAVSPRYPVTVCPSADGRQCRKDSIWEDGWI